MTDTNTPAIIPRAALDAAIDAARLSNPVIKMDTGETFAFVPDGYNLNNITQHKILPAHIKQKPAFDDAESLINYCANHADNRSILTASYLEGKIIAILDYHHDTRPDHCEHVATLALRKSEEFARWDAMEGKMHNQEAFALFMEENVADLASPDHTTMLEICRDLEATQGSSFKSGTRLENGDRTFLYESETKVKSDIAVPTEIKVSLPLYYGEEPVTVLAKFRFKATTEGLVLGFVWHRVEYMRQAAFDAMAAAVARETNLPIYRGRI